VDCPAWTSFFAPDDVGRASVVSHRHLLLADTIFDEQLLQQCQQDDAAGYYPPAIEFLTQLSRSTARSCLRTSVSETLSRPSTTIADNGGPSTLTMNYGSTEAATDNMMDIPSGNLIVAEDSSEDSASFTSDTTTEIESPPIGLNCSDAVPGHICCASAYEPVDGPVWTSFFAPDDVGRASVVSHRHLLLADTIFDEQLGI
jgi:hypothetical protein